MLHAPVLLAPPVPSAPPRRRTPIAMHVLAVLQYLGGLVALAVGALFGYLTVVASRDASSPDDFFDPRTVAIAFGILAAFSVFCGAIGIVLGRKLQRGRQWARVVVLMLSGLSIVVVVGSIVVHSTGLWTLVFTIYPALCITLLNLPAVRAWVR